MLLNSIYIAKTKKIESTIKISDVVNDYWAEVRMLPAVHVCLSFYLGYSSSSSVFMYSIFIFPLLAASM